MLHHLWTLPRKSNHSILVTKLEVSNFHWSNHHESRFPSQTSDLFSFSEPDTEPMISRSQTCHGTTHIKSTASKERNASLKGLYFFCSQLWECPQIIKIVASIESISILQHLNILAHHIICYLGGIRFTSKLSQAFPEERFRFKKAILQPSCTKEKVAESSL